MLKFPDGAVFHLNCDVFHNNHVSFRCNAYPIIIKGIKYSIRNVNIVLLVSLISPFLSNTISFNSSLNQFDHGEYIFRIVWLQGHNAGNSEFSQWKTQRPLGYGRYFHLIAHFTLPFLPFFGAGRGPA